MAGRREARKAGADRLEQELERRYLALYHGDIYAYRHLQQQLHEAQRSHTRRAVDGGADWYRQGGQMALWLRPETLGPLMGRASQWREQGFTMVHLCPPEGAAVEEIQTLAQQCHSAGLRLCVGLDLHTTGADHLWAAAARAGEAEHRHRYLIFDDWTIPDRFQTGAWPACGFQPLPGEGGVVMTWGGRDRWVLDYRDPVLFNDMAAQLMALLVAGADMICLRGLPYLWKELDGRCEDLPQGQQLLRMLRIICQQLDPQAALMGDGGAACFGTNEAPGCHLLLDGQTGAAVWDCLATGDVRLLRRRVDALALLPLSQGYAPFLREWEGISWQLDYPWLMEQGHAPQPHRRFLNRWYTGRWEGSAARGELWGDDLDTGMPCGTCASLCGVERGAAEEDEELVAMGLRCMETLHALLFALGGVPHIWQGDAEGQLNDYGYHRHPRRYDDPRWLHSGEGARGPWQQHWQDRLMWLARLAQEHPALAPGSALRTLDAGTDQVLALLRRDRQEQMVILLALSPRPVSAWLTRKGRYLDIETGQPHTGARVELPGYGARWFRLEEGTDLTQ